MKTETEDKRFVPTHSGVIKFTKKYKKLLVESGDDDFIRLADMEGERIALMSQLQMGVDSSNLTVPICDPIEMMLPRKYIIDIEELEEELCQTSA